MTGQGLKMLIDVGSLVDGLVGLLSLGLLRPRLALRAARRYTKHLLRKGGK